MRHCTIIFALLIALSLADSVPELKASFSYKALRDLELKLVKPIASMLLKNIAIPINLDVEKVPFNF